MGYVNLSLHLFAAFAFCGLGWALLRLLAQRAFARRLLGFGAPAALGSPALLAQQLQALCACSLQGTASAAQRQLRLQRLARLGALLASSRLQALELNSAQLILVLSTLPPDLPALEAALSADLGCEVQLKRSLDI